jgi:hypothetical protein
MPPDVNTLREQLVEYNAIKEKGDEPYPTCPRCLGDRYVSACVEPEAWRPVFEDFPCPVCVMVATVDVDEAITWIRDQIEMLGEDPDKLLEEENAEAAG